MEHILAPKMKVFSLDLLEILFHDRSSKESKSIVFWFDLLASVLEPRVHYFLLVSLRFQSGKFVCLLLLRTRFHKIIVSSYFNGSSTCSKLGVTLFDSYKNCVKLTFGGGRERERGERLAQNEKFRSLVDQNQSVVQKVRKLQKKTRFGKRFQRGLS